MCTSKSLHYEETKLSPGINIDHGNYVIGFRISTTRGSRNLIGSACIAYMLKEGA